MRFLKKVTTFDHTVTLVGTSSDTKPALGKPGVGILLVDAPRTEPDGAFDKLPLFLLPLLLLPPPFPLETVPLIFPPDGVLSAESEDSVPVTSDALAMEIPDIAIAIHRNIV